MILFFFFPESNLTDSGEKENLLKQRPELKQRKIKYGTSEVLEGQ